MDQKSIETASKYIETRVSGMLEKMTVDLLVKKPDSVVDFMMKWLDDQGQEVQGYYERKNRERYIRKRV